MCNLSKGVEEKGIMKATLSAIKNLMANMGWSLDQAMEALGIPEADRARYTKELAR